MSGESTLDSKPFPLPQQHNLQTATDNALEALAKQPPEQLQWLGARVDRDGLKLPVLNSEVSVDLAAGRVTTVQGADLSPPWRILVLHYLCVVDRPEQLTPEVTFGDLASARTYASVYSKRVIGRLCATAGRDAQTLQAAAAALAASSVQAGDLAFDLKPFPLITVRVIWHGPDEEFGPSATMLLPRNIESFFCSEDTVVLSEQLVSRLCGKPL